MKNLLLFFPLLLATSNAVAQTKVQHGIVRMITHSATDPIVPVQGVQVVVENVASKASDKNGRFSMNIAINKEQSYQVIDVRLPKGSTLLLASPTKKKKLFLSKNDLEVALITPENKDAVSKATFRKLLKKYNQQAEQLRKLRMQLEDQRLELEENTTEYKSLTLRIDSIQTVLNKYFDEKNRKNTTKDIECIAEKLTLTDYQSFKTEDARIYELMQNGEWSTLSAYLLKLMNGDAVAYVQEAVDQKNAAKEFYENRCQELSHRLERIESAIESFKMQHINDSVSHYYVILCNADPTNWKYLNDAGYWECTYTNRYDLAMKYFSRALACTENDKLKAGNCYNNIGVVYFSQGDYTNALQNFQKALEIWLSVSGENNSDIAECYNNIGIIHYRQDKYDEALECYQKAANVMLGLIEKSMSDLSLSDSEYFASILLNIGNVHNSQGNYSEALKHYLSGLEIFKSAFGESYPQVALFYNNIGTIYYHQNNYVEALDYYQKALTIRETLFGENHSDISQSYYNIGSIHKDQGNYIKALEYYQKALMIDKSIFGENNSNVANDCLHIGDVYNSMNNYTKALEYYQKALMIDKSVFGENDSNVARDCFKIGNVYNSMENYLVALEYFQKVQAIKSSSSDNPLISKILQVLIQNAREKMTNNANK